MKTGENPGEGAGFYSKQEVIDFIYESYLKAKPYLNYKDLDAKKRNPNLTKKLLSDMAFGVNVLVTGSKGKGSVAHMLSRILQSAGEKTGLFTSPHILDFCERIRVDEKMIPDEKFLEIAGRLEGQIRGIKTEQGEYISPIGITAAIALSYFKEENTKVNVLECGKGVRYDDTKNIRHGYGAVTPVFLEHTRELGTSIEKIAEDKSHIIQPGLRCIFLARQQQEVFDIFSERAKEFDVELQQYGVDFISENILFTRDGMEFDVVTRHHRYSGVKIPLLGIHQAQNCALALALGEEICGNLDEEKVKMFLEKTEYPGRMEILDKNPLTLLDACINRQSAPMVKEVIARMPHENLGVILAIPEDKDYLGVASAFRSLAKIMVFTSTKNPHYRFSRRQAERAREQGLFVCYIEEAGEALDYVKSKGVDMICILGTTSLISEIKEDASCARGL